MLKKRVVSVLVTFALFLIGALPAGAAPSTEPDYPDIVFGYFEFEARGNEIPIGTAQQAIGRWASAQGGRTSASVEIVGPDGETVERVANGSRAYITDEGTRARYDLVVRGDAAGTGKPGLPQITSVVRVMNMDPEDIDTYTLMSADINGDGQISIPDIVQAAQYFSTPDPAGPIYPDKPVLVSVPSANKGTETYRMWAHVVRSHLFANDDGGLTRVEYVPAYNKVVIEDYSDNFELLAARAMDLELPLWGGFFAGEEHNYMFFGDTNLEESDSKEVIRCVKFDKDWNRLGQASLVGSNTTVPFDAGSLQCDEYGGYLYVKTCHTMYTTYDGLNHQANVMFSIRQSDMQVVQQFTGIANLQYGYVSHSFNQLLKVDDEGRVVTFDHGDAHPRGIVLIRYNAPNAQGNFLGGTIGLANVLSFPGEAGNNNTGASLGGMAITSQGYLVACNMDTNLGNRRDIVAAFTNTETGQGERVLLTETGDARTPVVAALSREKGYVLWNSVKEGTSSDFILHYRSYAADGSFGEEQTVEDINLSECQPIPFHDRLVWYATDRGTPVFYTLDASGVQAFETPSI